MRNPAAQGKPDANHAEIIAAYEDLYCTVVDLHDHGFGCPDLLVGIAGSINDLVEVKTDAGHLEPSQMRFANDWRGRKPIVVRSRADVINHVQNARERILRGRR